MAIAIHVKESGGVGSVSRGGNIVLRFILNKLE